MILNKQIFQKSILQLQVPLQLPCYDFVSVTFLHMQGNYNLSLQQIERIPLNISQLPNRDGRCVQGYVTNSPQRADLRLLTIPSSCSRVSENNLNWENFYSFTPVRTIVSLCGFHCNASIAQSYPGSERLYVLLSSFHCSWTVFYYIN